MNRRIIVSVVCLVGMAAMGARLSPGADGGPRDVIGGGKAELLAAFPGRVTIELIDHGGAARSISRAQVLDMTQIGGVTFLVLQTAEGSTSYVNIGEVLRITALRDVAGRNGAAPAATSRPALQIER